MVIDPMLILTNGGPQDASLSLALNAYQVAFQFGDLRLGYAAAMNLVLGLTAAVVALVVFRVLRDDDGSGPARRGRDEPVPVPSD
jgi:ABC-type sugar transport system permease subunit